MLSENNIKTYTIYYKKNSNLHPLIVNL